MMLRRRAGLVVSLMSELDKERVNLSTRGSVFEIVKTDGLDN